MAYRKLLFGAGIRIVLMLLLCSASAVFVYLPGFHYSGFLSIAGTVLLAVELIRFITAGNRRTIQFFSALNAGDFNVRLNNKETDNEFASSLNGLAVQMQQIAHEKSKRDEILRHLIDNIPFGIICFKDFAKCELLNDVVRRQLGMQVIRNYADLQKAFPDMANVINGMIPGERRMIRIQNEAEDSESMLMRTDFSIAGEHYLLLTFGNVTSALDKREMESWSKMMRVLHHEMVNGITPVVSLSGSVLQSLENDIQQMTTDEMREAMTAIHHRAEGLLRFTTGYRRFTRISSPVKIQIETELFIQRLLRVILIPPNIQVTLNAYKNCYIIMDAGHLEQVLTNLILNACDAIGDKQDGKIDIQIVAAESRVRLTIRDNGCGMTTEQLAKVFIPFFTTKDHGQGIGLSLSRELVRLNGGQLRLSSRFGEGSMVEIIFN